MPHHNHGRRPCGAPSRAFPPRNSFASCETPIGTNPHAWPRAFFLRFPVSGFASGQPWSTQQKKDPMPPPVAVDVSPRQITPVPCRPSIPLSVRQVCVGHLVARCSIRCHAHGGNQRLFISAFQFFSVSAFSSGFRSQKGVSPPVSIPLRSGSAPRRLCGSISLHRRPKKQGK